MKIKLSKGELKKQRDGLKQYLRYLPTLQLKKQQLQAEILQQQGLFDQRARQHEHRRAAATAWAGLLVEADASFAQAARVTRIARGARNVAGIDIPVFERAEFADAGHDLFLTPAWYDPALEHVRALAADREELRVIGEGIGILRRELRVTAQRVNLFEKVKIPQAREAIRRIKIYLGDQMTNAVGRSKIAKKKIEEAFGGMALSPVRA